MPFIYQIEKPMTEDYESADSSHLSFHSVIQSISASVPSNLPNEVNDDDLPSETAEVSKPEAYKRSLSGGLHSPKADVPRKAILQRINSKKAVNSYQLGDQLLTRWSTGAGPRIGCIADYPLELRLQALELTNLSPRRLTPPLIPTPRTGAAAILSPSAHSSNVSHDELEAYFKM